MEQRIQARNAEITAVQETIATLTKDDAADLLRKTVAAVPLSPICEENFTPTETETFEKQKVHRDMLHTMEDLIAKIELLTDEIATAQETDANMELKVGRGARRVTWMAGGTPAG